MILSVFQCFKDVSSVFWRSCKGNSRVLQRYWKESFQSVPRKFQGGFREIRTMCQKCFKVVLRVLQVSFVLHGTHRSYLSRRRACFLFDHSFYEKSRCQRKKYTVQVGYMLFRGLSEYKRQELASSRWLAPPVLRTGMILAKKHARSRPWHSYSYAVQKGYMDTQEGCTLFKISA